MKKIMILFIVGLFSAVSGEQTANRQRMNILVYPFESVKGDRYSWIAPGLTDTVISDLSGIRGIYVFSDSDRKKALQEITLGMTGIVKESDIVRAGRVMGANIIFTGSVQSTGTNIRVNARLIDIETTKIQKAVKLDGTVNAIFDLQDKVVLALMNDRSDGGKLPAGKEKMAAKKPSGGAYELYAKGLELNDKDPRKALEYYLKAIEIEPEYVDALVKAGSVYDDLKQFDDAVAYLSKAQGVLERGGAENTADYAGIINGLGVVYRDMGDHGKAIEYYSKSQVIREKLNMTDTVDYAETLSNIGIVYVDTGKYDRALEYYFSALKIFEGIDFQNSSKYAILLNNIGGVYWSKRDNDMALKYYRLSQDIRDKLGLQVSPGYAYLMNNIGGVYWRKGDNKNAILYYVKSREIREWLGLQNTESYSTLMSNIALTYSRGLNDPCRGLEYMKRCVEIDQKNNFLKLSSDLKDLKEMQDACGRK